MSSKPIRDIKSSHSSYLRWATWTCVFGDDVLGIWEKFTSATDINAADVYKDVIVTGDDLSRVRIHRFPSTKKGYVQVNFNCLNLPLSFPSAQSRQYSGHSSHVTNVRFLSDHARFTQTFSLSLLLLFPLVPVLLLLRFFIRNTTNPVESCPPAAPIAPFSNGSFLKMVQQCPFLVKSTVMMRRSNISFESVRSLFVILFAFRATRIIPISTKLIVRSSVRRKWSMIGKRKTSRLLWFQYPLLLKPSALPLRV